VSAPQFLVESLPSGDSYSLAGREGHHAATVQRLHPGEPIVLADGRGGRATGVVTSVGRGSLEVRIDARAFVERTEPHLVVVQGIAKGDRGELAVQAMTEVGVDTLVPWSAARCVVQWRGERGERSRQRWVETAREAAKQARRAWLPEVTEIEATPAVARRLALAARALVLHEEATDSIADVDMPSAGEVVVIVGPEGGVTPDELVTFGAAGAKAVRLGGNVLRTSTAGAAALAALSVRLGRW
jgi:16S rRNA (uracil1498-N3)-methyltransferase